MRIDPNMDAYSRISGKSRGDGFVRDEGGDSLSFWGLCFSGFIYFLTWGLTRRYEFH